MMQRKNEVQERSGPMKETLLPATPSASVPLLLPDLSRIFFQPEHAQLTKLLLRVFGHFQTYCGL